MYEKISKIRRKFLFYKFFLSINIIYLLIEVFRFFMKKEMIEFITKIIIILIVLSIVTYKFLSYKKIFYKLKSQHPDIINKIENTKPNKKDLQKFKKMTIIAGILIFLFVGFVIAFVIFALKHLNKL